MYRVINEMKSILTNIEKGGDENARKRHLSKGKLLPRQRLTKLLDERQEIK